MTWQMLRKRLQRKKMLKCMNTEPEDFELMEQALQHLGEPCKEFLESYYLRKKNMSEIAKEFGYTNADNAKNQKYKCLMRLKKIFFGQYNNNNYKLRKWTSG